MSLSPHHLLNHRGPIELGDLGMEKPGWGSMHITVPKPLHVDFTGEFRLVFNRLA